jgi:hypothetical protein
MNKQSGSTYVVLVVVLVVALIGALGFIFWQNILVKPTNDSAKQAATSVSQKNTSSSTPALDMIDYGKGVEIDAIDQSNLAKLHDAPASFVSYMRQQLNDEAAFIKQSSGTPSECNRYSITIQKIYKQSYAVGNFSGGCVGGADEIWAKNNGVWVNAASTQDTYYVCGDLQKYKIPASLVDGKCELGDGTPGAKAYVQP